jgi:hypothetical protein
MSKHTPGCAYCEDGVKHRKLQQQFKPKLAEISRAETNREYAKLAAKAHTNLTMWAAIQALLESGCMYEGVNFTVGRRVIAIAEKEQQRHLTQYDSALAKIKEPSK